MDLHNGFVLHFHPESKDRFRFFSQLCRGQPALFVCHGKTDSLSLLPVLKYVNGTFSDFREGTVKIAKSKDLALFSFYPS